MKVNFGRKSFFLKKIKYLPHKGLKRFAQLSHVWVLWVRNGKLYISNIAKGKGYLTA